MDNQSENPQTTPQQIQKSGNFFSVFGKIVLVLVVVGGLVYGGYYFGISKKNQEVSPTPTPTTSVMEENQTGSQATNTPSKAASKIVKAGLTNGSTSFKPYSIEIPAGWTDNRETTSATDKLSISKNGYSISIYQAAFGGGGCLYKGDADAPFAQMYTNFEVINGKSILFRRSWNTEGVYNICQKNPTENSYGTPTMYGAISAKSPNPADVGILAELDGIIASITNQ